MEGHPYPRDWSSYLAATALLLPIIAAAVAKLGVVIGRWVADLANPEEEGRPEPVRVPLLFSARIERKRPLARVPPIRTEIPLAEVPESQRELVFAVRLRRRTLGKR